ncbi:MAG: holo-ACP synthase [Actinomycetota bacterium]
MIRVGIDIVDIARLERVLARWPRMAERVFTPGERSYAEGRSRPSQHLAARFAAKEATFKALGEGWPRLSWHEVEVVSEGRQPRLRLSGKARELAGTASASVSLAHDAGIALAQVVLEEVEGSG